MKKPYSLFFGLKEYLDNCLTTILACRGECACTPVRFFAILSTQRSGSGWFETLLNSHINISSNGEIFSAKERRSNISSIIQTLDKVYNLDWYSSAAKNECTAAVGFKWMLNQVCRRMNFCPTIFSPLQRRLLYSISISNIKYQTSNSVQSMRFS